MSDPNTPDGVETLREPFLSEEPPQEVVDNIRARVILSGVTDPKKIEAKVKEGLEIAQETRRKINAVLEKREMMSPEEVVELMLSSKSPEEWDANCDKVKEEFGGYPYWWFEKINRAGIEAKAAKRWDWKE